MFNIYPRVRPLHTHLRNPSFSAIRREPQPERGEWKVYFERTSFVGETSALAGILQPFLGIGSHPYSRRGIARPTGPVLTAISHTVARGRTSFLVIEP